jgi:xanthine dehydrogenase accessory factor
MSVAEIRDAINRWTAAGMACGVATLVRVERSAPRRPGARYAVSEDGEAVGSISSGCVEGDLHEHIVQSLGSGPRLVRYGITDEMAAEVGLACGGEIEIVVQPHLPDEIWNRIDQVVESRTAAVLFTGLSEFVLGDRMLVLTDGVRLGTFGGPADMDLAAAAGSILDRGGASVVEARDLEFFAEALLPPPRLAIVGATPIAEALTRLATGLGYAVTLIDPRPALATEERFPDATIVQAWPEEGLRDAGLDRYLCVAVLAHDPKLDVPALDVALRAGCRYVGLLGGRRTQGLRSDALRELGVPEEAIRRVRGPIGLDIGAVEPTEIALSIAAELVAFQAGAGPA